MASNTATRHDPARWGELERGILSIVWRLGAVTAEQGRLAMEADRKVKSMIDASLKNGKARPVN
jgi:hypothetical protein